MATNYSENLPGPIATGPAPPSVHLAWMVYNPAAPNGIPAGGQVPLQCDGSGNLLVNVAVGGGGGGGGGSVTQGTIPWVDNITQIGGAAFALGQQLAAASLPVVLTAAQISTLTPLSTVAVTQSTSPWVTNITQWNSVALGSPSAYGTSPGAVNVPGVNAFVTNTVAVSGTVAVTQSTSPWIVAGGGTAGTPGTAVLTVQGVASGTAIPVDFSPSTGLLTHANVTGSTSGNTSLITGTGGKNTYVYRLVISVNGATNVEITDSSSSTVLLGPYYLTGPGASVVLDYCGEPWAITTSTGDNISINLSAATSFSVDVWSKQQ